MEFSMCDIYYVKYRGREIIRKKTENECSNKESWVDTGAKVFVWIFNF